MLTTLAEPAAAEPEKKKREYKDMEEKHDGDLHAKVDMNTVSLKIHTSIKTQNIC